MALGLLFMTNPIKFTLDGARIALRDSDVLKDIAHSAGWRDWAVEWETGERGEVVGFRIEPKRQKQ